MLDERPSAAELIAAVAEFLEKDVVAELPGSKAFHAKVAIHALRIVERELRLGPSVVEDEAARLRVLLGPSGSSIETLDALDRELCRRLEDGDLSPDDRAVRDHLLSRAAARLAIDNPRYPSLANLPRR